MLAKLSISLLLLPRVAALTSAEDWSDFADNFATDLAPLITLFGEQVTKQFLSESTDFLDNIIFGLAPLGILTAVVSAIRLYGKASLKSFVGRAQEPHGAAEAELCSSTSQDVCELWSNGGICRVFGRPKILEFIFTKGGRFYPIFPDANGTNEPPHCGIYPPVAVLSGRAPDESSRYWHEVFSVASANVLKKLRKQDLEMMPPPSFPRVTTGETREQGKHELFAPHPNLSLNVGTRRTRKPFLLGIIAAGLFLQGSFFVYATWATFYNARFYTDSDRPLLWSFILGMTGTLLLACGMCLCAVLVERRSTERRFQVVQGPDGVKPRVYWLQCGNQRVGDQLFHSFAFSKEKTEYITSCIAEPDAMRIFHLPPSLVLWVAILLSVTGFVCQFAGIRGLHGSITLYQLACTLVMSIIRSLLRSRRLRRDQNLLKGFERVSDSNELDWQALCMTQDETVITDEGSADFHSRVIHWSIEQPYCDSGLRHSASVRKDGEPSESGKSPPQGVEMVVSTSDCSGGMVGFRPREAIHQLSDILDWELGCASNAVKFIRALEGDVDADGGAVFKPLRTDVVGQGELGAAPEYKLSPAARALYIRARLGYLTSDMVLQPADAQWDPELQDMSRRLQAALQNAADYIFQKVPLDDGWKGVKALVWSALCRYSVRTNTKRVHLTFPIHFLMRQKGLQWTICEYQLAAVMSLWRHAILDNKALAGAAPSASRRSLRRKIFQAAADRESAASIIRLWVTKENAIEHTYATLPKGSTVGSLPYRLSLALSMRSEMPGLGPIWTPLEHAADASPADAVSLLSIYTPATLLEAIAQDIFVIFMFEAASIIDRLSEVSVRQPPSSAPSTILNRDTGMTPSDLHNVHLDALARILCEAGLATTEEAALMSIVPALFHHSKLPSLDAAVGRLLGDARKLRNDRQYEQGDAHLKSLLRICSEKHQEKVVRALGELYREASRSPREADRIFGVQAMAYLRSHATSQGETALSKPALAALEDYQELADFLKDDPRRRGRPWEAKALVPLDLSLVLELHEDLKRPREGRSRIRALLMLERYDVSGRNRLALHEFLFVAIAFGYVEVVQGLRALNPSIIFETPGSSTPTEGPEPLIFSAMLKYDNPDPTESPESAATIGFLATVWAASQLQEEGHVPDDAEEVLRTMLDWTSTVKDLTNRERDTPLMYTVGSDNAPAVRIMLEYGIDFLARNANGKSALSWAIVHGAVSAAEVILKAGQQAGGLPPTFLRYELSLAFEFRRRDLVEMLLRYGANIDEQDEQGITLLSTALELNPPKIVNRPRKWRPKPDITLFIEYGATVSDSLLTIILKTALDELQLDRIQALYARGCDVVGALSQVGAITAVLEAEKSEELGKHAASMIRYLLEIGVSIRPGDLHRALLLQSPDDILTMILEKSTSNNTVLEHHGTPIQTLLDYDHWSPHRDVAEQEKVLDMMISAGCDVNLDSPEWRATPLQIVCCRPKSWPPRPPWAIFWDELPEPSRNIELMLLRAGARVDLTAADVPGERVKPTRSTPLELACLTGKFEVVRALLDAGAAVNTDGHEFGPPLQAACLRVTQGDESNLLIIRALIEAGADVNAVSQPVGTALAAAALLGLPEFARVLLDAGANPQLDILDVTGGEYEDAWEACTSAPDRLMSHLTKIFNAMQTGKFKWETLSPDPLEVKQKRKEIKQMLEEHTAIRTSMKVYQSICFQNEYMRLSPEEIRWRNGWGLSGPDCTSPNPSNYHAPEYLGFMGPDPVDVSEFHHISSQFPYDTYSAEELRLSDYSSGRQYGDGR